MLGKWECLQEMLLIQKSIFYDTVVLKLYVSKFLPKST